VRDLLNLCGAFPSRYRRSGLELSHHLVGWGLVRPADRHRIVRFSAVPKGLRYIGNILAIHKGSRFTSTKKRIYAFGLSLFFVRVL
jgi:hypothetical protein